jgi:aconitate hydratase 2/2-methylisocitrate dehydratase
MPLNVPESVLVRFHGAMKRGINLRDLVNAIPYVALQEKLLTIEKKGKINVFDGRILEIEGLPDLSVSQAFELTDASAERSAAACTIRLNPAPVIEHLKSNVELLTRMIKEGYGDKESLGRRRDAMKEWLAMPKLLEADADAEYAEIIDIDIGQITEPLLACPNDPDDIKTLSAVAGAKVDEVFLGSCMTEISHFRAAAKTIEAAGGKVQTKLWVAPPTVMDQEILKKEGLYDIFRAAGARMETPGCSLCMGNQATAKEGSTVVSTSTRNFPNRLGKGTSVFLSSAAVAAVTSVLGRIPTLEEYNKYNK